MFHHHFHKAVKYSSLIMISIIFILIGLLFWNFQGTKADAMGDYELTGWLWSYYYSWISLNSGNLCPGEYCSNVSYAVTMSSTTKEIYGWGWSPVGWVCFGKTCVADSSHICNNQNGCDPSKFGTAIPAGGWAISVTDGVISGWAKILSLGDQGWIAFNGGATSSPPTYFPACYNCLPHCKSFKPSSTECMEMSTSTYDSCKICFSTDKLDGTPFPPGTPADLAVPGGSGKLSFDCKGLPVCTTVESSGGAKRIKCDNCNSTISFGSGINSENGSLVGWSWNGNWNNSYVGAGWIHLNADYGSAGILYPWLETNYGSIYGKNDIRQKGSLGKQNATYCIFADTISGVNSGNCSIQGVDLNFPISSSTNVYRNALGKIDVKGLETAVTCKGQTCYNKYGNELVTTTNALLSGEVSLDNKVYKSIGDLQIGSGLKFNNGIGHGNGTIIVNGNLIINNDFQYSSASGLIDLKKLASVAWIVKGDVVVASGVTNMVGAFIILGKDKVICQHDNSYYPKYSPNRCGVFFSSFSENPLTVYGVIVAKAFDFRRTYANPSQGSERIIYDGRIIANPPPGFKGFVEGLPVMKDF